MKRIQLALAALWLSCIAGLAASSLGNIPISQMSIATNVLETAWFPIIQPLPGRTTNDNFRVQTAVLFNGRSNLVVTNLTVVSNFTFNTTVISNIVQLAAPGSINPTVPYIPFNLNGTNFGDSSIYWLDTNSVAAKDLLVTMRFSVQQTIVGLNDGMTNLIDPTYTSELYLFNADTNAANTIINLMDGFEPVQYLDIFSFTNLPAGWAGGYFTLPANSSLPGGGIVKLFGDKDWIGGNGRGISLRYIAPNWVEVGRWDVVTGSSGLWTEFGTFIAPTGATNVTHVGTDGFINIKGPTFSELQLNGQTSGDFIDLYSDDAQQYWHIQSQLNSGMLEAVLEPTLAEGGGASPLLGPYWFGTVATYTNEPIFSLVNGTNAIVTGQPFLTFGPQSQINFSTTNVLYRSGSNLVETNGATQVEHEIRNGAGRSAFVGLSSSGQAELRAANGANAVFLHNGTDIAVLFGGGFLPNTTLDLGSNADTWRNIYLATNSVIYFGTNAFTTDGANHPMWNGQAITVP